MQNFTSIGQRERRTKGRNSKPMIYLLVEAFILGLVIFFISLADIPTVTILAALAAIFCFMVSCLPRYRSIRRRQMTAT